MGFLKQLRCRPKAERLLPGSSGFGIAPARAVAFEEGLLKQLAVPQRKAASRHLSASGRQLFAQN